MIAMQAQIRNIYQYLKLDHKASVSQLLAWGFIASALGFLVMFSATHISEVFGRVTEVNTAKIEFAITIFGFITNVFLAPFFETVLMFAVFAFLRLFTKRFWLLVVLSACLWASVHYLHPFHGLGTFLPFIVFSYVFLTQEPYGTHVTLWSTAFVHAIVNLIVTVTVAFLSI